MVHSMMNEKSKLNVAAILKAEQEYHEAKAMVDYIDKMPAAMDKLTSVDSEVKELRQEFQKFSKEVVAALGKLEARLNSVSIGAGSSSGQGHQQQQQPAQKAGGDAKNAGQAKKEDKKEEKKPANDDDVDLFGSDDDDEEAEKAREERLAAAAKGKKSNKPAIVAKSMIILDVKPWDDETDVVEMEKKVRSIEADGLVWGTSKFVEVAYGIKKLQITSVVEDDKIGTDWLEEQITGFEDYVQSIDIVAFNKI